MTFQQKFETIHKNRIGPAFRSPSESGMNASTIICVLVRVIEGRPLLTNQNQQYSSRCGLGRSARFAMMF